MLFPGILNHPASVAYKFHVSWAWTKDSELKEWQPAASDRPMTQPNLVTCFCLLTHLFVRASVCDRHFLLARTQVIIRQPDTVAMQWNAIVLPFCWHLWVGVGVAMVVLILCLAALDCLIRHYSNIEDRNFGFAEAVFIVYSAMCQQGRYLQYRLTIKNDMWNVKLVSANKLFVCL
jgi:hypothetical protein